MDYQLFLQHKDTAYDVTTILAEEITWEAGIGGEAGRLCFSVIRDGVVNFVEGDMVRFLIDGVVRFLGWVITKERTSDQIIFVTAADQLFYLAKNRESLIYWDKTAVEVIRMIAGKHGLKTGEMQDGGWKIPQRIEEGQSLLDMVFSALEMTKQATGKEYFFFDQGGALTLKEKKSMNVPVILGCDGGISEYWYKTDISQKTYNTVKLYQAGRKEAEQLAYQEENKEKVLEWGRLQYYAHVPYGLNQAQLKEIAGQILENQCKVEKKLTIENINGDFLILAGHSLWLEIPDLAEISLMGEALVEKCVHTFKDGEHRTKMEIRVEG